MYTHTTNFDSAVYRLAGQLRTTYAEIRRQIDKRRNRNDFTLNGREVIFIKDRKGYHFAVEY